jgi:hypothetical protein
MVSPHVDGIIATNSSLAGALDSLYGLRGTRSSRAQLLWTAMREAVPGQKKLGSGWIWWPEKAHEPLESE